MENIEFITKNCIIEITPLYKGWSGDSKYILTDKDQNKYLLRISKKEKFQKRKEQFEILRQIEALNINCSKPIEFGVLDSGESYMILSYLEGEGAEEEILKYSDTDAYKLGVEAGTILKKLHSLSIPSQSESWWDRYEAKMKRKIDALKQCEYKIPMQEEIIKYYIDNCHLMKNRPLLFCHGDYHLGNMVIHNGHIGIVDFDKANAADPYDEFKPFCWNVLRSEYFETGLINGYFDNNIPEDFFKILKFYTAESLISHLPWAVSFGEEEIKVSRIIEKNQMKWYDNFKLEIPIWYKGIL